MVLSSPEIAPSFVEGSAFFDICSPEIQIQIVRESATNPAQMRAEGLAYLLYTSGQSLSRTGAYKFDLGCRHHWEPERVSADARRVLTSHFRPQPHTRKCGD